MDIKFDEIRAQIERQKDSYIDLLQNEIMILKNETETSLKKSIGKELGKINSEISNIQDSFQRYSAQIKENQDNTERRNEESYRST